MTRAPLVLSTSIVILADYWRTSGDLTDVWSNMSSVGFRQAGREKWSRPGHWTDPDMLVVGKVGWGPTIHDTRLTPNEQITHISLWALQAAPLLIGADMTQLDPFTTALLTNHEVLEMHQDVLGRSAARLSTRTPRVMGQAAGRWHDRSRTLQSRPTTSEDDGDLERARDIRTPTGARLVAAPRPRDFRDCFLGRRTGA